MCNDVCRLKVGDDFGMLVLDVANISYSYKYIKTYSFLLLYQKKSKKEKSKYENFENILALSHFDGHSRIFW